MPGAGSIDVRSAQLRLVDGLLALYHGAAIKHAEKVIFHYLDGSLQKEQNPINTYMAITLHNFLILHH